MSAFSFNPVLVKELRQLVRGRFIASVLLLFLAIQLCVIGTYVLADPSFAARGGGRGAQPLFYALMTVLKMACYLCIPAYVATRLSQEHRGDTVDLLFVTTLTPGTIVRGKLCSGLVTTALLFSAVMPYMTFIHLLRGLDLSTVFISLVSVFLWSAVLIQLGIFLGALPGDKSPRLALGLAFFFLWAWIPRLMGPWLMAWHISPGRPSGLSLEFIVILVMAFVCLHAFSIALLSPRSANRALPVRATVTGVWAVGLSLAAMGFFGPRSGIIPLCSMMTVASAIALLVAVSERDTPNARIRRTIPRNRLLRLLVFPFFSGAASGIVWAALMTAAALAVAYAALPSLRLLQERYVIPVLFVYAFSYALTAVLIRRWLLSNWVPVRQTGLIALLLMAAGVVLPLLIEVLVRGLPIHAYSPSFWHLGSVAAIFLQDKAYAMPHLIFAWTWAAIVLILNRPWLADQIRAFRPPDA